MCRALLDFAKAQTDSLLSKLWPWDDYFVLGNLSFLIHEMGLSHQIYSPLDDQYLVPVQH